MASNELCLFPFPRRRRRLFDRRSGHRNEEEEEAMAAGAPPDLVALEVATVHAREAVAAAELDNFASEISALDERTDPTALFTKLKELAGTGKRPEETSPLVVGGGIVSSEPARAKTLMCHFAEAAAGSGPPDWETLDDLLQAAPDGPPEPDFTLQELDAALAKVGAGKSPGPDDIPPDFLLASATLFLASRRAEITAATSGPH
eukprot:TRINITY_DN1382_c1_g1_i4.p3 TRINITY_DN1382_c1_g1~~TRINITY_DN1382_c1_g1_i4.p3  ORF type:complete len:204 (-),score=13.23 TRINITY_DN1382_c1_g1_i4:127-738(-)